MKVIATSTGLFEKKKGAFYSVFNPHYGGHEKIFYLCDYPDGEALAAAFEYVNEYGGTVYRDNEEIYKNK